MKLKPLVDGSVFTRGRIVHFVDKEKHEWPFLLVNCTINKDTARYKYVASGWVFGSERIEAYDDVPYDILRNAETFHFPSMGRLKRTGPQPGKPLRDLTVVKK